MPTEPCEVSPINGTKEVLACDRHVLGVTGPKIVMTFIRASAALHTAVEKHPKRAAVSHELPHLIDRLELPVWRQFSGKTESLLVFGLRPCGPALGCGAGSQYR